MSRLSDVAFDPCFTQPQRCTQWQRRDMLAATAAGLGMLLVPDWVWADGDAPTSDPAAHLKLPWTGQFKWGNVVDVTKQKGRDWHEKLDAAQAAVVAIGGGVVYFPAGRYEFCDHIRLKDGVVLRGANPRGTTEAKSDRYDPPTRFEFPRYTPLFTGDGTPIDSAFKGVYLDNPTAGAFTGVVNVAINRGHIHFGESDEHRCGGNRIVFGCVLRNEAVADPAASRTFTSWPTVTAVRSRAATFRSSAIQLAATAS